MMMSCNHPFSWFGPERNDVEMIRRKEECDLPWKKENGKNVKFSSEFKKLFEKMVAFKREDRLSMDEILSHSWFQAKTSRYD